MKAKKTLSLLLCASVIVGMLGMMSGCSNSTSQSPSPAPARPRRAPPPRPVPPACWTRSRAPA